MIKIALCDDEKDWLQKSKTMLLYYSEQHPEAGIRLTCFSSGRDLLNYMIMNGSFDIYVLDVVMPQMSGIELGVNIRKQDDSGKIIYLTSSPDFGVDSYIANAFYYLLKPIELDTLSAVLTKAVTEISRRKEKGIKVKTSEDVRILGFDDIVYVELNKKALCFHLYDKETVESVSQRESFSVCISPMLSDSRFVLCGTSICVNLFYVKSIDKDGAVFKNGERLWLSKKACATLRSAWLDFWFDEGDGQ